MRTVPAFAAALIALLALAAPSLAEAQHAAKGKNKADAADTGAPNDTASTTPSDALRTPTAEELAALADAAKALVNDDATGLTARTLSDGTVGVDLQDRFQSVAVAVKSGGDVKATCVTSGKEADQLRKPSLTPVAQRPAGLEEK